MRLRSGIGMSAAVDACEAGRTAATQALAALGTEAAALIVVYASPAYDLPALLASIREVTRPAQLVGATSGGHFASGAVHPVGLGGVEVLALTAGPYRFGIASASGISGELEETGRRLARESQAAAGAARHGAVLLFTDWLIGDQQQLIQGIYRVTGPRVPTVGGAAADLLTFGQTMVFHDDQVLERGAVTVWIASERALKVVTRHGWEPIGVPMLVGRVDGTDLQEMGGQPAAAAYFQQLGLPADTGDTRESFWAVGLDHPLAIMQPDGSLLVRAVIGRTASGSLTTTSQVPVGSVAHVTTGTTDALLDCIEPLAQDALVDQPDAGVVLTFSCVARAEIFGERTIEEPLRLQRAAGEVPTFGFWTFGEYGRTCGVLGTHNATITALAL